jgi:hypothetical protein
MKVQKHDHYNIMWTKIWSAPVGTPVIPLGEEFPVPDPDDKEAPKPVWKFETEAKYAGFSEGVTSVGIDREYVDFTWLELRAGTLRVTNPRMVIARGELENPDYEAQIVYFDVRDGVLYPNKDGDRMKIQISKKVYETP